MIRAIAIIRCSTQNQFNKYGPEVQLLSINDNLPNDAELVDKKEFQESASKWNRVKWEGIVDECIEAHRQGQADMIIFPRVDRETRFLAGSITKLLEVIKSGMQVYFASDMLLLDPNKPDTFEDYQKLALDAQAYIRILKRNTGGGLKARARKGLIPCGHCAPFGYKIAMGEHNPNWGKLEIVPEEAVIVKELFDWVASGKSACSWVTHANKTGIKQRESVQGWTIQQVSLFLRNTAYKGQLVYGKTIQVGEKRVKNTDTSKMTTFPCPALVSIGTWDAVQNRLQLNRKHLTGKTKYFYLLRKMMTCKNCGKGFETNSRFGRRRFYLCRGQQVYPHIYHCNSKIMADVIEPYVWNEVVSTITGYVSEDMALDRLIDKFNSINKAELLNDITHERKFLEQLPKKRSMVMTREQQGHISSEEATRQFEDIKRQEDNHNTEIAKYEKQLANCDTVQIQKLIDSANWLKREFNFGNFDDVPDEQKRAILEAVVDKITVDDDKKVDITLKLPNLDMIDHTMDSLLSHRLL